MANGPLTPLTPGSHDQPVPSEISDDKIASIEEIRENETTVLAAVDSEIAARRQALEVATQRLEEASQGLEDAADSMVEASDFHTTPKNALDVMLADTPQRPPTQSTRKLTLQRSRQILNSQIQDRYAESVEELKSAEEYYKANARRVQMTRTLRNLLYETLKYQTP